MNPHLHREEEKRRKNIIYIQGTVEQNDLKCHLIYFLITGTTAPDHLEALLTSLPLYFLCHLSECPSGQRRSSEHTPHGRRFSAPPPTPLVMDTLQSVWPSRDVHMALCSPGRLQLPLLGNQKKLRFMLEKKTT